MNYIVNKLELTIFCLLTGLLLIRWKVITW